MGWSAEEFAVLNVPFAGRSARTTEYVEAMRAIWREDVSSYTGTHVHFESIRCYPKPVRRGVPVVFGGNSDRALQRVATHGDGWYGFNVSIGELPGRLDFLRSACRAAGRAEGSVDVAVALRDASPDERADIEALGVDELVLVAAPPGVAEDAAAWVRHLAETWGVHP